MKKSFVILAMLMFTALLAGAAIMPGAGCHSDRDNPKDLLDTYFTAMIRQDFAAVYDCYYNNYRSKIGKDEYIKHRREAALLQAYRVKSISEQGNRAKAQVELTYAPSETLKRDRPYLTSVTEEMVREHGEWKIKVW